MAEFTPEIAPDVLAACQAGAEEAGQALTRALDSEIEVSAGDVTTFSREQAPENFDGPGLAVVFTFGDVAAVALLPEAVGFVPEWYSAPDATGESKLTTLAQELSMLLVPEEFMADDFKASKVLNLNEALERGEVTDGAGMIPLTLTAGEQQGVLHLIWPATQPSKILKAAEPTEPEAAEAAAEPEPEPTSEAPAPAPTPLTSPSPAVAYEDEFDRLPPYSRSLLRVKLPLMVNLATKKQSIDKIVELGAGTILKFEKSCDELLELEVNGHPVARGEAVKVGDKFGLRINSMIIPDEHFKKLEPRTGT